MKNPHAGWERDPVIPTGTAMSRLATADRHDDRIVGSKRDQPLMIP